MPTPSPATTRSRSSSPPSRTAPGSPPRATAGRELFGNYLPDWLLVTDPRALQGFHEGGAFWASGAWHAWLGPLAWWGGFLAALFITTLAINTLLRKQWTERERLSYPIAQIPLSITGDFHVWRNRLFLIGFGVAFAIDTLNGFAYFFPSLPSLPTHAQSVDFASWPWSATGGFTIAFYPFAIGLGYLLPVDLLFSCWFFYWFWKAQYLLTAILGFGDRPGFPYVTEQCSGGYLGICLFSLYLARRHLLAALRRAFTGSPAVEDAHELASYRLAFAGLLLGVSVLVASALRLGVPLLTAAAFFAIYLALSTAVTRIRAELGPPTHDLHSGGPDMLLPATFGTAAFGPRTLVFFSVTYWMNRALRSQPMPHQMEGLRIGERRSLGRGPLLAAILLTGAVGIVAAFGSLLYAGYHYGWSTSEMGYAAQVFGREPYDRLANWLTFPQPASPESGVAVLIGIGVSLALLAARLRFLWWPLHPVGYAVSSSWSMNLLWMPLCIAWVLKLAVLRYGGLALYRPALPFFLGLILGEYVAGGLWSLAGIALHRPEPGCSGPTEGRPSASSPLRLFVRPLLPLRPHQREEDHVADRGRVGEEHDQPVDAQAEAARRGHPVLEGAEEVLVHGMRFLIAGRLRPHLLLEAAPLLLRIVQLGERVRDFQAAHEALEALRQLRVVRVRLRQGGDGRGVIGHEGRLHQRGLHELLEEVVDHRAEMHLGPRGQLAPPRRGASPLRTPGRRPRPLSSPG